MCVRHMPTRKQANLIAASLLCVGCALLGLGFAAHRLHLGHNPELRWTKALLFMAGLGLMILGGRVFYARGTRHLAAFASTYLGSVCTAVALAVHPLGLAQDPAFRGKRAVLLSFGLLLTGFTILMSRRYTFRDRAIIYLKRLLGVIQEFKTHVAKLYAVEFVDRPRQKLEWWPLIAAASAYSIIVVTMWGMFAFSSGMPSETALPWISETTPALKAFIYTGDPLRPFLMTFTHIAYLISEVIAPGSFVPYQFVYAGLWLARGILVFVILRRLVPHSLGLAYIAGALTLVHASDGALQWIGQMHQFAFIFWLLLAIYFLILMQDSKSAWLGALFTLLALTAECLSLWTYESGIFIMALAPFFVLVARWPVGRLRIPAYLLWYAPPAAYITAAFQKYVRSPGGSYEETVLRTDWSKLALIKDWGFNISASLSFWRWQPIVGTIAPHREELLTLIAVAVFVGLGLWSSRAESHVNPGWNIGSLRVAIILIGTGLAWVVCSFPAYLLLVAARNLWRTQLLSGPGAAVVFTGVVALTRAVIPLKRVAQFAPLCLAGVVVCYGVPRALERGGWHRDNWEIHREAMAALLRVVPKVAPGAVVVMTNVPKQHDPFGHDYWFDMALRLAYPRTAVAGVYFYDDGSPAMGNVLNFRAGSWVWNDRSGFSPLVSSGNLNRTIVVRYEGMRRDEIVDQFPEFLCSHACDLHQYKPGSSIAGTVASPIAARRYGPL